MKTQRLMCALTVAAVGLVVAAPAHAGPDWLEQGDAGSLLHSAQVPTRPSPSILQLSSISGTLATSLTQPDYEDLYFIKILDPVNFTITLSFADFNAVMYLFQVTVNGDALGMLANDDQSGTSNIPKLLSTATDSTGIFISSPGDYVLAIAGLGRVPVSATGPIFNLATPTEISGPDGPGGFNPLIGWTGVGEQGRYVIGLEETDFPRTPAPGTAFTILGAVGAVGLRRRR
ncbi:MAG: hypothetical protein KF859_02345 [Phycisphaeraceae bacterium]|nr:hypothetical protein [Phycisphaeraceae bacterium]